MNLNLKDFKRFEKQIILKKIGISGQKKIFSSKVLIIGIGGLGCPLLTYLAASGVGTIGIVDYDRVDISNLSRQTLFVPGDVGKFKVNQAKKESAGYEPYAKQIHQIYKHDPAVLDEVINILFYIAEADGNVSNSESIMIENIAKIFKMNKSQFEGIKESRKSSDKQNPYIVLGCNSSDNLESIREKYLQLSKEHHPDILINKGVPNEVIEESKKKMRAINSAYDQIKKMKS